jgi:alkanesulfonate monooxygenase SsuD/methylene tetrahydromethanopterin reductase-like flavin-dependent oxidoreductase (luciferase family)
VESFAPSWPGLRDLWRAADQTEVFESGWVFDHVAADAVGATGPCYEAGTLLAALAQATSRLRLGTMVLCAARRHPMLLAQMALTLDAVSEGRLELGVGGGWRVEDHQAHGVDLGGPQQRADRLDEYCAALVGLLSGRTVTADGEHFAMSGAQCDIPPVQQPHPPICIGGSGERRTIPAAARWAQHWNCPGGRPEEFVRKRALLRRHCAGIGRDPAAVMTSTSIPAAPDPRATAARAAALARVGVDLVIVQVPPPYEPRVVERLAAALGPLL